MANIEQDLQAIMDARYGRDVRQSIHDAIYDINEVNEANISTVQAIADTAQGYANTASQAKTDAQTAQTGAETAQTGAETAQTHASNSAEDAEAWAVGKRNGTDVPSTDPTYENNSKYWQERANYWYEQAKSIAESFSGALRPMGTVTFANLPPVSQAAAGDMYNVSDEFTTTSDFVEGAGHVVPLGSNIYLTTNSKWDILAGSPVTGIKGDSESNYRRGNVNITKANIGLGNVDNTSDANKPISTAVQTALDQKASKSWTNVGTVTGRNPISFSDVAQYNELLFIVTTPTYHAYAIPFPRAVATGASVDQYLESGAYQSSSLNAKVQVKCDATNKTFYLNAVYENGTEVTATSRLSISAR